MHLHLMQAEPCTTQTALFECAKISLQKLQMNSLLAWLQGGQQSFLYMTGAPNSREEADWTGARPT